MNFTITFGWWLMPAIISFICFIGMVFTYRKSTQGPDMFGIGAMFGFFFSLLWFIPALLSWATYFAVMYFAK